MLFEMNKEKILNLLEIIKGIEEPSLNINNFYLWIRGRQFPESKDFWDCNWLNVIALYLADDTIIKTTGAIIHLQEISLWIKELYNLDKELCGKAELKCIEPYLYICLEINNLGNILFTLKLTPDHLKEKHEIQILIDQTYLKEIIRSLENILKQYPIKYDS